jgi:hypothetical protein
MSSISVQLYDQLTTASLHDLLIVRIVVPTVMHEARVVKVLVEQMESAAIFVLNCVSAKAGMLRG